MAAEELRALLTRRGAALVGYADLTELPAAARLELPRAVSIAVALRAEIVAQLDDGPTVPYQQEYLALNELLARLAGEAATFLRERGHRAEPLPTTVRTDAGSLSTPLPHKVAATRSGLGWIGRSNLLVSPGYGPAVRLTTVLTDAPLPCGEPVDASRCGTCDDCVSACPGKAVKGPGWKVGMARGELYDAFACRDTARARAAAVGVSETICGVCIAACPYTKRYLRRSGQRAG
jgi:epoxyqueuosine reductase